MVGACSAYVRISHIPLAKPNAEIVIEPAFRSRGPRDIPMDPGKIWGHSGPDLNFGEQPREARRIERLESDHERPA
jgi:hypothetical protein